MFLCLDILAPMTSDVAVRSIESTILLYKGARGNIPTINYHLGQIEQSGEIHLSNGYKKYLYALDKWSGEVFMYNLDVVKKW